MRTLDFNFTYNGDGSSWSIPGASQSLLTMILQSNMKQKLLASFRNSSLPIYRLEQCVDNIHAQLLPWPIIKSSMGRSKKGRTPFWFNWLSSQHAPQTYDHNIIRRLWVPTTPMPSTDRRKKEWLYFLNNNKELSIGRLTSRSTNNTTIILTHWSATSRPFEYMTCTGCTNKSWLSSNGICQIQLPCSRSAVLPDESFIWNKATNTITTNISNLCPDISLPSQLPPIPSILIDSLDVQLIKSSFHSDRTIMDLTDALTRISLEANAHNTTALEIYTDGSLDSNIRDSNDSPIMGSGWIIPTLNILYGCSSTMWPSSTKAELIAIWTALLAIPLSIRTITIYTDSQAALDGINGFNPHNIRQYTKTPNGTTIEQILRIISIKQLSVTWVKVKGHSGDFYNDAADNIAKRAAKYAQDHEEYIISPNYNKMHSSMAFRLSWNNHHWTGSLRKHLTTFASLPHCADWATMDSHSYWTPDDTFNTRNIIPSSLVSKVNNVDNIDRLSFSSPLSSSSLSNNYIRWDYLWNFFKTIRHQNRFGPSFSNFNSFALKCANNILPTGDNLAKRHDQIYDNWTCSFCNRD